MALNRSQAPAIRVIILRSLRRNIRLDRFVCRNGSSCTLPSTLSARIAIRTPSGYSPITASFRLHPS
ncbi:MAG: hypothetical protein MZV63_20305 [Marinilabiliales bacterium]|nr:hypothetical protein [Marinilabiliales bacterium]